MTDASTRFWAKVQETYDGSCWRWLGTHNKNGYGLFWPTHRSTWPAHRYMYLEIHGAVRPELEIHHTCNNPGCVNPDHLEEVTRQYNMSQSRKAQQTHCKWGHEYTPENTYIKPNGCRNCKRCISGKRGIPLDSK